MPQPASRDSMRAASARGGGLFHPVTELTQQSLAERRLRVLRTLTDGTCDARTVEQAISLATGILADHVLDLPFVLIYLLDADLQHARLAGRTGLPAGTTASPERIALGASNELPRPLARVVRSGQSEQVEHLDARLGPVICGPYPEPLRKAVLLPVILPGLDHPLAVVAGVSTRRPLDHLYCAFYDMLGVGITTAVTNARAYEQERKRAEALAEIDRAKTAFFSNVSHEFRTPLALMLGPLEESLNDPDLPLAERHQQRIDTAHRNAQRLLKLVNSLLDFARIEAGRAEVTYTATELATFTSELAAMFSSAIESAGLQLIVDCQPLPQPVYVDPDMWEKIVLNLLSNAFKFTFAGAITVRLQWRDGGALLSVSDTGTGVPPEQVPRLFERFHRVPNARGRTYEGSGIGLALVQELVKLHGGTIGVESVLNQGTTFTVVIPGGSAHLPTDWIGAKPRLAPTAIGVHAFVEEARHWLPDRAPSTAPMGPASELASPMAASANVQRARILLADDNADMRDYVRRLLAPYWDVEAVADGMQALEAARRAPPDLMLTDIMMPHLDGFGLLRAPTPRRSSCYPPGRAKKRGSRGCKPGLTIIWSSPLALVSCWRESTPISTLPICVGMQWSKRSTMP